MTATLTQVHDAITESLKTAFSHKVRTIRVHSPLYKELQAPALLLALESMRMGKNNGDGRTAIDCDFTICGILAVKGLPEEKISIAIGNFAAEIIGLVENNHWGLGANVTHPENISGQPAEFKPGKQGYESWAVTWQQTVYIGDIEEAEKFLPDTLMVGQSPEVGSNHKDDYVEL